MPLITLDANFVRTATCPAGKNKENYYDTAITGFILECRSTGGKTYALRYRDTHDRQIQHKIGDVKSISFDKARSAAQTLRARVVLGEEFSEVKKIKRQIPTLSEFFYERALPFAKGSNKRSWKSDDSIFRNHLQPRFGNIHLDEISHQAVYEFHHALLAGGYAKATCNRALVLLKLLYNLGRRWKIPGTETSPCMDVPHFVANNSRERFLTSEETKLLLTELEKSDNPQLKNIVAILILTGARKRELLDARLNDIDTERCIWTIPLSKSGKARHIPLSDAALSVLTQLPRWDGCPYLVPNPKTLKPYTCFYRAWDTARKNVGLSEVRIHDLRHSAASFLINANISIFEVSKILGHSQIKTTQRYAHLSQDTLLAAVNTAANATGVNWSQHKESKAA